MKQYPVDRETFGALDSWHKLLRSLPGATEYGAGYGTPFDNDVFTVRPFDWDPECTCGVEALEDKFHAKDRCAAGCVGHLIRAKSKEIGDTLSGPGEREFKRFLKTVGVPYRGCMIACDCGFKQRSEAFHEANPHTNDCRLYLPNFRYKPTGYEIRWYKYPFRGADQNMPLTAEKFLPIVRACLASLAVTA